MTRTRTPAAAGVIGAGTSVLLLTAAVRSQQRALAGIGDTVRRFVTGHQVAAESIGATRFAATAQSELALRAVGATLPQAVAGHRVAALAAGQAVAGHRVAALGIGVAVAEQTRWAIGTHVAAAETVLAGMGGVRLPAWPAATPGYDRWAPAISRVDGFAGSAMRRWLEREAAARREALAALLAARDAALHGDVAVLDEFLANRLRLRPTAANRDALFMVLLDPEWPDGAELPVAGIRDLRARVVAESRNHKRLGDTQLRGRPVRSLEQAAAAVGVPVGDLVSDPSTRDGLPLDLGFGDPRLDRLLRWLDPDERRVVLVFGCVGETWSVAATLAGLPPEFGERVRRKCKRLASEMARRATRRLAGET